MPTVTQCIKGIRGFKKMRYNSSRWLLGCPQKRAVIVKLRTMTPRKPNSAIRKIAKVKIASTGKKILAFLTGKGHNLQEHSVVLLRGGKANDLPGVHYKMIRGKYDFLAREDFDRKQKRSRYSIKKFPETRKKFIKERKYMHSVEKYKKAVEDGKKFPRISKKSILKYFNNKNI